MSRQAYVAVNATFDLEGIVEFLRDGETIVFGGDPTRADLVVGVIEDRLADVFGRAWRMDSQL